MYWVVAFLLSCVKKVLENSKGTPKIMASSLTVYLRFLFCFLQIKKSVEKSGETQTSIRLASNLVIVPNSRFEGHEFKSPMQRELGALTKSGKTLGVRPFYSGGPDVITWSCQSVKLHSTRSLACHWQTHMPGSLSCPTPQQTILLC
jgi:hypothetical protein